MNVQQRDLILQSIDQLRDTDDEVRAYFNQMEQDDLNALFVKNLVNVQGDERDVIIISTIFNPAEKKDGMIDNIYSIYNKMDLTKKELKMLWGMHKKLKNQPKI